MGTRDTAANRFARAAIDGVTAVGLDPEAEFAAVTLRTLLEPLLEEGGDIDTSLQGAAYPLGSLIADHMQRDHGTRDIPDDIWDAVRDCFRAALVVGATAVLSITLKVPFRDIIAAAKRHGIVMNDAELDVALARHAEGVPLNEAFRDQAKAIAHGHPGETCEQHARKEQH